MAANLQFITSFQITSSQETTDLDNIFTTEYDVYQIVFTGFATVGTSDGNINMRVIDDSGTLDSDNVYEYSVLETRADTSFSENKNTGFSRMDRLMKIDQAPDGQSSVLYVMNPKSSSTYTFFQWQSSGRFSGQNRGFKGIAMHGVAEAIRGIRIFEVNTGRPYDRGNIAIYGVK
jgi:hypothetical protein